MKNLIKLFLLSSVILISAANLDAKTPPANTKAELSYLKELVDDHISFPEDACSGEKGVVTVQILIDKNQRLKVEQINGCPGFKEYVQMELERIEVEYPQLIGKSFICKIDFRI